MKFCPQCGTAFETDARFCLECGFDRSSVEPLSEVTASTAENETINTQASGLISGETVVSEPKPGCPQCGTIIVEGDRFCQECGFDVIRGANTANIRFQPVEKQVINPEPAYVAPVVETPHPPLQQPKPANPQFFKPPVLPPEPVNKRKKSWLTALLIVVGIAILGVVGWFVYTNYFSPTDGSVNEPVTEGTHTETGALVNPADAPTPEPAVTNTNSPSKIDQELAKYRSKEKNNKAQQATTANDAKPNPTGNDLMAKVLYEVGHKEEPKSKNPKNPAKLMIQKPTVIVRITTDHYNNGMGTSGIGNISIKDRDGNVLGTYKIKTKNGKDGAPDAKWIAEPHVMLDKGTYFIWDSDFSTWSKNFVGNGFVVVEGYEVE